MDAGRGQDLQQRQRPQHPGAAAVHRLRRHPGAEEARRGPGRAAAADGDNELHAEVAQHLCVVRRRERRAARGVARGVLRARVGGAVEGEEAAGDEDVNAAVGRAVVVEVLAHIDAAVEVGVLLRVRGEAHPAVCAGASEGAPAVGGENAFLAPVIVEREEEGQDGTETILNSLRRFAIDENK